MSQALIDTSIIIPAFLEDCEDGADRIVKAQEFFRWLDKHKFVVYIAAPTMTEILLRVPPALHAGIIAKVQRQTQILPFDTAASVAAATLHYERQGDKLIAEIKANPLASKAKIRADCQIIAIGMTRRLSCIYSLDPDLKKLANGKISVKEFPEEIQGQQIAQFEPAK